jgi:PDDEXK-like domain of unknown function (DUF3799)
MTLVTPGMDDYVDAEVLLEEPGIYQLTEAEYHADPVTVPGGSLSCSGAKKLLPPSCPARFEYDRRHPPEPKEHLEFGTAAHKLVLGTGPDLEVVPGDRWDTRAAKQQIAEIRARGAVPVKERDMQAVQDMATALRQTRLAAAMLDPGCGLAEQSIVWQDAATGVWRRARTDFLRWPATTEGRMITVDYKTATSADLESVRAAVARYCYHMQDPWYRDAVAAAGLDDDPAFCFVFQEKTPPYLVNVVQLDDAAVRAGQERNRLACEIFRDCTAAATWPGYCDYTPDPDVISLPPWAVRPAEDLL